MAYQCLGCRVLGLLSSRARWKRFESEESKPAIYRLLEANELLLLKVGFGAQSKQRLATLSWLPLAAPAELVRPVANAYLLPARNYICKFPRRAHRLVSSRTLGDYSPEAKAIFLRPPCSSQRAGTFNAPQGFTRSAPKTFDSQKTPPQQALSRRPN